MTKHPIKIQFKNTSNPRSGFDVLRIEDLFKREVPDHNPFELHKVEFFILLVITRGKGLHTVDFIDYNYQEGSIITIRKDQIHKFSYNTDVEGFLLLFTDDFLISYLEKVRAQQSLQLFNELLGTPMIKLSASDFETTKDLILRILDEYFDKKDNFSLEIIRSELHILITKLYRIKSSNNHIITSKKHLSEFLNFQHLVENTIPKRNQVKDYAKMMGVSSKTLNNIVQSILRKPAKEFIDEISTKQIKRLLINTSFTIKEIAFESGFEETTNFYKYFKRQTGVTPEQFRSSF